jgi:hypothetical protein
MSDAKKTGPYFVNGQVEDYDLDGEGTCLTTALISYAEMCRRTADDCTRSAAALLKEAERAEAAATAAEMAGT